MATGPKEERSSMWIRASEEQLHSGVHAIKLENREGFWMEKPDMWSKYLRRPITLEDICLAQFAKMYKGTSEKSESEDLDDDNQQDDNDNQYYLPSVKQLAQRFTINREVFKKKLNFCFVFTRKNIFYLLF